MQNKKIYIILIGIFVLILATACKTADIIDLIHKDTEQINYIEKEDLKEEIFLKNNFDQYKINDTIFIPNLIHSSKGEEYYSLYIDSYRISGTEKFFVNNIVIEGIENVDFDKLVKSNMNKQIEFNYNEESGLEEGYIELIEPINDNNMNLNKDSRIKVVLNMVVEDKGEKHDYDLEYVFESDIRTYLLTR